MADGFTTDRDELEAATTLVRAIVPLGTDITTADRVEKIEDRNASQLWGALDIDAVLRRRNHLELLMRGHA